ncbi:hypothetical protein M885DRAFT_508047 [Pelagophyceae sp. CCMP2097]|nr:hypothetical protein M885DRAFT_508047 [Pelagophyceae sp. CCMP2097]
MSDTRYHAVGASEKVRRSQRSEAAERVAVKIQALAWVILGAFVLVKVDVAFVLLQDANVDRFWLNIAVLCFAVNCVLCAYLTVWLPYVQRVQLEWSVFCPRVIPAMTAFAVVCGFGLLRGLWPVWGLLTPVILAIVFMACLMSLHFIPFPC